MFIPSLKPSVTAPENGSSTSHVTCKRIEPFSGFRRNQNLRSCLFIVLKLFVFKKTRRTRRTQRRRLVPSFFCYEKHGVHKKTLNSDNKNSFLMFYVFLKTRTKQTLNYSPEDEEIKRRTRRREALI